MWTRRSNLIYSEILTSYIHDEEVRRDIHQRSWLRNAFDPCAINDVEFLRQYRLSKEAFAYIVSNLQHNSNLKASKRASVELKVLCALSFYATGSYQRLIGQAKFLGQTTVSKFITEVTDALIAPGIIDDIIKFPQTKQDRDRIRQKFFTKYGFPGVIGCIDGSHFHIVCPKKEIEHQFFCRKHYHSLNVQMICDSDGQIINVNPKYGGAAHDAFIWENSAVNPYIQSLQNTEPTWLLGDSGYPQRPWLMTPFHDPERNSPEEKYNYMHVRTRVVIENTFGVLKNRWRCLCKDRTLHYKPEKCAKLIMACCVLHNIAIKFGVAEPTFEPNAEQSAFTRTEVVRDSGSRTDELSRGRAMRDMLVRRFN